MFLKEDCFRLGSVARIHGYKGEVSIFLDVNDPREYKELESVFVEIDGKLIPFFLEHLYLRNKGFAVAKFETIDSDKKANMLLKCGLYLPKDLLPEKEDDDFYHFEIENFKVIDDRLGEIGIVKQVLDISNNPIIQIDQNGSEILIPKQNEFIKEIDWDEETIYVSTPKGLIEMYLGEEE
ncbi:MAG: 16S rRNA processing protein RimM [Crocinitomicaceae bacterium]|nr:16S rRNA processing protein RimM [Crocinitomicaceae bacterium]